MALTVSLLSRTLFGNQKVSIADVTFDSSYPTGGEVLDLNQLGLSSVNFMQIGTSSGHIVEYDYANKKLKVRTPTNAAAAHSHTENTAASYTQNATTGTSGAVTAAAAAEVANATNLSAVSVRIMAYGS